MGIWNFIQDGGMFMYIILGLSIIALAITLEKFYVLLTAYQNKPAFFQAVVKFIKEGDFNAAKLLCARTNHPLAKILLAVFRNCHRSEEAMESAVNVALQKVAPQIQKRTHYILMIGNISTLVGLLGTIQGLIISFMSLQNADAAEKAKMLAAGISTAMYTTAFGLIVAIPCIVAYTILSNKESNTLQEYNETVSEVIHTIVYELNDPMYKQAKQNAALSNNHQQAA